MNKPREIHLLDAVALADDLPAEKLSRGQVGTVVENFGEGVYEVEFSDDDGRTYALLTLKSEQLIVLHFQPVKAA